VTRRAQRGFTLIELMIALVISSLLVGMILAIFSRMSLAYRAQQQIAGVQQVLAAARATIELDAKQAGLALPQGFTVAAQPGVIQSPVQVVNSSTGPDRIAFFYADTSAQAKVVGTVVNWTNDPEIEVDTTAGFAVGDLVAIVMDYVPGQLINGGIYIAKFTTCVVRIRTINAPRIKFTTTLPWGTFNETQCGVGLQPPIGNVIYRFVARGYRIDTSSPARTALGPLQLSETGGLFNDETLDAWKDIAYGFTDIQTALQIFHPLTTPGDTGDPDTDPVRDWYSGAKQTEWTATALNGASSPLQPPSEGLLQMSISLVARTDDVEGVASAATPELVVAGNVDNNLIGDHASQTLAFDPNPAFNNQRIYRYTTFQVDFRNLGIGR
jgi:prepilin-type N-terminal cleavage/methylation domain-containing protein